MKETFVPREKMSKKARKEMDARKRTQWAFPPVSRVVPNKKKKEQAKTPRPGRFDAGWGGFFRSRVARAGQFFQKMAGVCGQSMI